MSTRGLARVEESFLQIQIERKSNMKQAIAIATLLLAGVASTAAQSPTSNRTEQELKRLTREVSDSALRGDKAVAERYLADKLIEREGCEKAPHGRKFGANSR